MMTTTNRPAGFSIFLFVCALAAACGGNQSTTTTVVEEPEEVLIEDIPGVNSLALDYFNDGVRAMNDTPRDYGSAVQGFQRAAELDPDFWEAWANLGLAQMDLGLYLEAAESFRSEMSVISDLVSRGWPVRERPEVYLDLGKAYALAGRVDAAAEAFNAILAADPTNTEARANLAALYARQGQYEQSRSFISDLLEMSQNDVGALNVLATIAKAEGDMNMAEYLWEKCLGEVAGRRASLTDEAQYEDLTEDEDARLRGYNAGRLQRLTTQVSDVQNELGIVAWSDGEMDRAERLFRESVENNPSNFAARKNLAVIYLEYANYGGACEQLAEALALRPRDLDAMLGYGSCNYGLGDPEAAYAAYEAANSAHADSALATQRLGDIAFRDLSDSASALRWYERNLQIRGLSRQTCERSSDRVCAAANSIVEMQNMDQQPGEN